MSLKRSLLIFFAVALPIAAIRIGLNWAESIPAEESSIPIVNRAYLVLQEVVAQHSERAEAVEDRDFTHEWQGHRYATVGETIVDLGHMDAGSARIRSSQYGIEGATVRIDLTREGAPRLADWTRTHLRHQVGLFVDGELTWVAVVMDELDGVIALQFTERQEAERILRGIQAGGAP